MVRARLAISLPCSVSSTPDLRRSTRLTLSSSSSSLICMLMAGWLIAQASAAWPKWRVSTKESRYRSCRSETMTIRRAYPLHKTIRLEIIITDRDTQSPPSRAVRVRKTSDWFGRRLTLFLEGELRMREWQKPTIDETESGMEVTSYLPAELDRA